MKCIVVGLYCSQYFWNKIGQDGLVVLFNARLWCRISQSLSNLPLRMFMVFTRILGKSLRFCLLTFFSFSFLQVTKFIGKASRRCRPYTKESKE